MIILVQLSQITDNPFQSRQEYGDIEELAADIARHYDTRPDTLGLQQVPAGRVVKRNDTGSITYSKATGSAGGEVLSVQMVENTYLYGNRQLMAGPEICIQLEFGHRRLRAFRHLAETDERYAATGMPVNVLHLSDDDMLTGVWSENSARKNLSAVEEAELLARKLESAGSQAEVAAAWGLGRSTVANKLRLLELPPDIREANRKGQLSERQALNLLPLLKLQDQIGQLAAPPEFAPSLNGNTWGPPAGPELVVNHILANPDTSSDDIRRHTKRIEEHAGRPLPDVVATFNPEPTFGLIGGDVINPIRQLPCKGCPMRIGGNRCLDPTCLNKKIDLLKPHLVAELAAELSLPISEGPKHFDILQGDWTGRDQLAKAFRAGYRENMVVGWWDLGYALRPDGRTRHVTEREALQDPAAALAIGYTPDRIDAPLLAFLEAHAPVDEDDEPPAEPHHDQLPGPAQVGDWQIEAESIINELNRRGREAIREHLDSLDPDTLRFVTLLLAGKEAEPGREVTTFMQTPMTRNAMDVATWYKLNVPGAWKEKLTALGLPVSPTPAESLAVLVLEDWFGDKRSDHWLNNRNKQTVTHIFDLTRHGPDSQRLATNRPDLDMWLDVARIDAAWWLGHHFNDERENWPDIPELAHLVPEPEEDPTIPEEMVPA